jgi:hypothetical protein
VLDRKKVRAGWEKKCVLDTGEKHTGRTCAVRTLRQRPTIRILAPVQSAPPHNLQYPHQLGVKAEVIMPQTYTCPCSKFQQGSKDITKRTIEAHLHQDQKFLQALPSDTDSAHFVKSCINQTTQLLSKLRGGPRLLGTASDVDGSHPEDPEGVLLSFF